MTTMHSDWDPNRDRHDEGKEAEALLLPDEDESVPTLAETPIAKTERRTIAESINATQRQTIKVPPPEPVNQFAAMPCGVPGCELMTARGYALKIKGFVNEGNFGAAEIAIRCAREAGMLGLIGAALRGTI
jgi:hypothetical protein